VKLQYDADEKLGEAYEYAGRSPDDSNQNGAIIYQDQTILSRGVNHFYDGVPPTMERPAKYGRIVHAETDACLQLAHRHIAISPAAVMFCPWATCIPCAIALIGVKLKTLVIHYERCLTFMQTRAGQDAEALQDWQPDIDESAQWLKASGCETIIHRGPVESYVGNGILINGRTWSPKTLEFVS